MLIYSDGVDQISLIFSEGSKPETLGHMITVHRDAAGITQCEFVSNGVQCLCVGKTDSVLRDLARHVLTRIASGR